MVEYRESGIEDIVLVDVMGCDLEGFPGHFGFIQNYDEIDNFEIRRPSNKPREFMEIAFTPEAQPRDVKNAFDVHRECTWNMQGCSMTKQVLPVLWNEKIEP